MNRDIYHLRKIIDILKTHKEEKMLSKLNISPSSWIKVAEGAAFAAAGAALTYLTSNLGNLDFGTFTPLVVAGLTIVVNYLHKLVTDVPTPPAN